MSDVFDSYLLKYSPGSLCSACKKATYFHGDIPESYFLSLSLSLESSIKNCLALKEACL